MRIASRLRFSSGRLTKNNRFTEYQRLRTYDDKSGVDHQLDA